jgi:hypothetical protein
MLRALFYAIPIVLAIYAIVDCLQTPDDEVRALPRIAWLVIILFFPIIGPASWLIAGREVGAGERQRLVWPSGPKASHPDFQRPSRRVVAPDDDPEFLSQLGRSSSEHDALLEEWERDLRRGEDDLRGDGPADDAGPEAGGTAPRA